METAGRTEAIDNEHLSPFGATTADGEQVLVFIRSEEAQEDGSLIVEGTFQLAGIVIRHVIAAPDRKVAVERLRAYVGSNSVGSDGYLTCNGLRGPAARDWRRPATQKAEAEAMASQQQGRFWEVMDLHGQKHVVCAAYYIVTGDGGLVFRNGEACPDDVRYRVAPGRAVASFSGYIYVKDIADQAQTGEAARESDNLEAQVARATAELAQEARQASEMASIKARLDRIEAEQAKHRDRLAQHRDWFERSRAEGRRRGWLKGMAFRLFGGGVV